jgi:hypothetical protein
MTEQLTELEAQYVQALCHVLKELHDEGTDLNDLMEVRFQLTKLRGGHFIDARLQAIETQVIGQVAEHLNRTVN